VTTAFLDDLARALAADAAGASGVDDPSAPLVPPARPEHGDIASPVAMGVAKRAGRPPREIAEQIAARLQGRDELRTVIERVEVGGPGFLNFTLQPGWFVGAVRQILAAGRTFGSDAARPAEAILLEFVSPNPTGPMHVGHARHAAYGDAVARILDFVGHTVWRECYVNDYGRQMEIFGASVAARYAEIVGDQPYFPEDGYRGGYVTDIAAELHADVGDRFAGRVSPPDPDALAFFSRAGGDRMLARTQSELELCRVRIDRYFSETDLHVGGRVTEGIEALRAAGQTFEGDGAIWFRTTDFGDEKDRVLVRSDGATTYLAADVAYHLDKASRMGDRMIDILGADHHGYINRLKAVIVAGGYPPDVLEVLIMQLVSLVEKGESKRMSKRAGTLVTLHELIDDIGVDATRFFLVERSHDTAFELDLDLAREQSQENPVYYVQYAHARCCSIIARATQGGVAPVADAPAPAELDASERALVIRLADWPDAIADAAERRAPHRLVAYLKDLARDLHGFYHRCRVVGEAPEVEAFRLDLTQATRLVLEIGLDLLGVCAPEHM
jgi:arginyl-tRNA synthetase